MSHDRPPRHAPWTGLHPSALIAVEYGAEFLRAAVSLLWRLDPPGDRFLMTAGHAFPGGATRAFAAERPDEPASHVGDLAVNLLDGTSGFALDIALVRLTEAGVALAERTVGRSKPVHVSALHQAPLGGALPIAQAFCPSLGDYGPRVLAERFEGAVCVSDAHRGTLVLRDLVRTSPAGSDEGDSGTLLATADDGLAVGSCVGTRDLWTYFEPIGRAKERLRGLGYSIRLWKT